MKRKYNLAYGCFLFWELMVLLISLVRAAYTDSEWIDGDGLIILLLFPLIIPALVALLVGIVLSINLWKQRPLAILTVLSLLLITTVFSKYGSTAFKVAVAIVYSVIVIAISGRWFLLIRKRMFPLEMKE